MRTTGHVMADRSHTNIEFKMKCLMTAERSHSPLFPRTAVLSARACKNSRTCRFPRFYSFAPSLAAFFEYDLQYSSVLKYGMACRKQVWNELHEKMSNKRTRNEGYSKKGSTSAPHNIIVQRLSSEPNNKQTYHPVQPREFVSFKYSDLTLINLKKACADHFNVPMGSVDVLVSNKGPSATNVSQIPHRKDKVSEVHRPCLCINSVLSLKGDH